MKSLTKKLLSKNLFDPMSYDRSKYGGDPVANPPTYPTPLGPRQAQAGARPILTDPLEMDPCSNLHGWQQQLVGMIKSKSDVYIISPAGSGKTAPIICYWVNEILKISTNKQVPLENINLERLLEHPEEVGQILWLVPIKNLSVNIEHETVERFVSIILQIINRTCYIEQGTEDLIFDPINLSINTIINGLCKNNEQQKQLLNILINQNRVEKDRIQEFITVLGQSVLNFVKTKLVGRIEEGINTIEIGHKGSGQYKPFIIAIYESSMHVVKHMDRLNLIIFDEAQRVQGGIREDDNKRAAQIGDSIHKILIDKNGKSAKLVMLSGSVSPNSVKNVTHFFNEAYGRKFDNTSIYQTPENVTNPSYIRVFGMTNLSNQHEQLRIVHNILSSSSSDGGGTVFVILGKDKINRLIDILAPVDNGFVAPGQKLQKSKRSMYDNFKYSSSQIADPGGINNLTDERLRRAASNGIGYLYRPEDLSPEHQHDTEIIQSLFKNGIIKVVFATDAIREGINITCSTMYIPTIINPSDHKPADLGSLAQLANRAGRIKGVFATIYTDPQFVGNITQAFSTDPKRFVDQPFMLPGTLRGKWEVGLKYGASISYNSAIAFGKAFLKFFT